FLFSIYTFYGEPGGDFFRSVVCLFGPKKMCAGLKVDWCSTVRDMPSCEGWPHKITHNCFCTCCARTRVQRELIGFLNDSSAIAILFTPVLRLLLACAHALLRIRRAVAALVIIRDFGRNVCSP